MGQTRPRRQGWARIRLAQQLKRAGELFSPTPACRTLFVLHAEKEKKINTRGEEELPGAGEAVACCTSGGAVAEAGGGVLAHGRRLQAKALLSQAAERGILPLSFSSVSSPVFFVSVHSLSTRFPSFSFYFFSLLSVLSFQVFLSFSSLFFLPFLLCFSFLCFFVSSLLFCSCFLPLPHCCCVGCYL